MRKKKSALFCWAVLWICHDKERFCDVSFQSAKPVSLMQEEIDKIESRIKTLQAHLSKDNPSPLISKLKKEVADLKGEHEYRFGFANPDAEIRGDVSDVLFPGLEFAEPLRFKLNPADKSK